MLVNNSGAGAQPTGYYPDPRMMAPPTQPQGPPEGFYHGQNAYKNSFQPQHMYYAYDYRDDTQIRQCACQHVPVHETFLHQILTGKGYKNDGLFYNRPMKAEVYHDYTCCYSLPHHHPGAYGGYPQHQ